MKVIKTEREYNAALKRIEALIEADPDLGTKEADDLEVLGVLIEKYEDEKYPMELPDPIEAIKFEMEQRGMSQRGLIPFIGSKSKVSELLSGKTPLTLNMVRSLHQGLGIPAEILLQDQEAKLPELIDCTKYPIKEMRKRGYFKEFTGDLKKAKEKGEELIRDFLASTAFPKTSAVLYKRNFRGSSKNDLYALTVWQNKAWSMANQITLPSNGQVPKLDAEWFESLIRLSRLSNGPILAREFLHDTGVAFVTLEHFPKTYLDGAAMRRKDGKPAVILTLRYDRLDNFWFVLIHELAHVKLHILSGSGEDCYLDDLDIGGDKQENDADQLAAKLLIPQKYSRDLSTLKTAVQIMHFAKQIGRHPSIIAGRIRRDEQNYRKYSNLVGNRKVRAQFDRQWG